jgi:ribosomal protein S21
MIEVRKKERETPSALVFRFLKRVKRSGVLREVRRRRFHDRSVSRLDRKLSALHRVEKKAEFKRMRKMGLV